MTRRPATIPETAERLGVSAARVRSLMHDGELRAVRAEGIWLVDADEVARRLVLTELGVTGAAGRPWSPPIAWAAMRALDADELLVSELDRKARYRLRQRLEAPDAARLLSAVRLRARRVRVSVHPSREAQLRDLVVPSAITGAGAHGVGLTGDASVDGYLDADRLAHAQRVLRVRESQTGDHLLRVVDDPRVLHDLEVAPRLAVAADLVDHAVDDGAIDPRVTAAIRALLEHLGSLPSHRPRNNR